MQITRSRPLLAACLLALLLPFAVAADRVVVVSARSAAGELVVIVSARSTVGALRADQVADIFLGQVGRFPDGGEAIAIDQGVGSPLRNEFYARFTAKTPALLKAYWTKMIFTGRGQPPREAPNSWAVRKLVADNPALIGYIDKSALDASVRQVLMMP